MQNWDQQLKGSIEVPKVYLKNLEKRKLFCRREKKAFRFKNKFEIVKKYWLRRSFVNKIQRNKYLENLKVKSFPPTPQNVEPLCLFSFSAREVPTRVFTYSDFYYHRQGVNHLPRWNANEVNARWAGCFIRKYESLISVVSSCALLSSLSWLTGESRRKIFMKM